jgi:N-acetylglucosamine-6-phosphate deacetylase
MSSILINGAEIVTPLEIFKAHLRIEDDRIAKVSDSLSATGAGASQVIDGRGCYLTPGLIDLQVNGSRDCNLWGQPTMQQFEQLRHKLLKVGVTSFLPTLITAELQHLRHNIAFLVANGVGSITTKNTRVALARVPGIHLEGPFLSEQKPGVHPRKQLQSISVAAIKKLITPEVMLMTLAPELTGASAAIKYLLKHNVKVSLGHSNATFEQAKRAFGAGVALMTHTYNALPALHHRAPGAVAAAMLNPKVYCTVIADGLHVHPAAIELLLKCKGVNRTILVSDAAWEGTRHGKLVGSSITVTDAVRNIARWKVAAFADAITMASYNPAAAMGLERKIGHIAPGKKADLLLWDKKSLKLKSVIFNGQLIS